MRPYLGNQVLEIGAGIGNMTVNLIPRTEYWATEVNPLYLADLRKLIQTRPYLRVAFTDVNKPDSFPTKKQFDTVVCINGLEHVENDVAALRNIRCILEEGGRAIIVVPQGPSLYGSLDRELGRYRRYTKEQLIDIGEQAGFRVKEVLNFNRASVPAWWLNGQVLKRTTFDLWQIKNAEPSAATV